MTVKYLVGHLTGRSCKNEMMFAALARHLGHNIDEVLCGFQVL